MAASILQCPQRHKSPRELYDQTGADQTRLSLASILPPRRNAVNFIIAATSLQILIRLSTSTDAAAPPPAPTRFGQPALCFMRLSLLFSLLLLADWRPPPRLARAAGVILRAAAAFISDFRRRLCRLRRARSPTQAGHWRIAAAEASSAPRAAAPSDGALHHCFVARLY